MELKLDSRVLAVTQRRQQQVVDVKEDKKWRGIQLSHPCYYRTNKLQSGTVCALLRCPHIHPVTLQITASGAVREVPVACQPPSRTTFTRKPGLPENQPNFLQSTHNLAYIQIPLSLCCALFLLPIPPTALRKAAHGSRRDEMVKQ